MLVIKISCKIIKKISENLIRNGLGKCPLYETILCIRRLKFKETFCKIHKLLKFNLK